MKYRSIYYVLILYYYYFNSKPFMFTTIHSHVYGYIYIYIYILKYMNTKVIYSYKVLNLTILNILSRFGKLHQNQHANNGALKTTIIKELVLFIFSIP